MNRRIFIAAAALIALGGCTDASMGQFNALGDSSRVVCYSGGVAVHDDRSTGRVEPVDQGEGLAYRSAVSGDFVRVYADCIVTVDQG